MDWNQAKDWVLMGIGGCLLGYARALVQEIQALNIKVALLLERHEHHEARIKSLEDRI